MSKWSSRVPSSPAGVIILFIGILCVYGLLSLFIFPYFMFDDWSLIKNISTLSTDTDGNSSTHAGNLFISFAASALQDIFFFCFTGLILLIFSMRKPEDDNLAQKLTYLFPQAKDDNVLREYLESSINKLGCMSDKSSFVFTLLDYNNDINAFKIQVHFESHLRNLHNKDNFSDPMLSMTLQSDLEEHPPSGLFGQLEHVKVYNFENGNISDIGDKSHNYPVDMKDKIFRHTCPFSIPPHSVALFDAKHWDWSPAEKVHNLRVARFTRSIQFKCINNSGSSVEIELMQIGSEVDVDKKMLDNHENITMSLNDVAPGGGICIKVKKTEIIQNE